MKKLLMILSFCLLPMVAHGAATERGFTITYFEPTMTACDPSTQLKPVSSPILCLEALGSEAQQKTCKASSNQRFEMMSAGVGLFQLKSQKTNLCLRMGANDGDPIIETTCGTGSQDQVFRIGPSPSAIQSNVGAGGLCLDVAGNSTSDGGKIQSFQCHGGTNQSFNYALSAGSDCPLDDLAGTKIYMDVIRDGIGGTVDTITATAKTGGGEITKEYCVPILDDATAVTIDIEVSAFDESGNESEKTPKIQHPVPGTRDCTPPDTNAPAIPSGFRLTF